MGDKSKEMTPEERALMTQMKESGASETEIAKKMAEFAGANILRGNKRLDETDPQVKASQDFLQKMVRGEASFVDDSVGAKQYNQARANTASEIAGLNRQLSDSYAKRGLSGGGQERGGNRQVALRGAQTLSEQATDIYSRIAAAKTAERGAALDAYNTSLGAERNLGLAQTGAGINAYGGASGAFGQAANIANSGLTQYGNRPSSNLFSQILGGTIGVLGGASQAKALFSSERFKDNIEPLSGNLDKVNAMRPVSFDWKPEHADKDSGQRIGVTAEELDKIDKRLVVHEPDGKPLGVRYQDIVIPLIGAVQELSEKVNKAYGSKKGK